MTLQALREALKPFAKMADTLALRTGLKDEALFRTIMVSLWDDLEDVTVGDLRRAREALSTQPPPQGERHMSDIVERINRLLELAKSGNRTVDYIDAIATLQDAAAEITRLRSRIAELEKALADEQGWPG